MELCLVRHGIAGTAGPKWPDDRLRPLTGKGVREMKAAAKGLRMLFVPDVVLTSPLLRAIQTAEILCDAFGIDGLHISEALASGDNDRLLADVAATRSARVVAVGHLPFMAEAISFAVTGDAQTIHCLCEKGSAALLSFPDAPAAGLATLQWLVQPQALHLIADGAATRR